MGLIEFNVITKKYHQTDAYLVSLAYIFDLSELLQPERK